MTLTECSALIWRTLSSQGQGHTVHLPQLPVETMVESPPFAQMRPFLGVTAQAKTRPCRPAAHAQHWAAFLALSAMSEMPKGRPLLAAPRLQLSRIGLATCRPGLKMNLDEASCITNRQRCSFAVELRLNCGGSERLSLAPRLPEREGLARQALPVPNTLA